MTFLINTEKKKISPKFPEVNFLIKHLPEDIHSHLHSQAVVLLDKFLIIFSPIADAVVDFQDAGMARVKSWKIAFSKSGSESPAVHAFTKVDLLSHNASGLILSKVLI